jgi:hypothetical protein
MMKKIIVAYFKVICICRQRFRNTTKTLRIVDAPAEVRNAAPRKNKSEGFVIDPACSIRGCTWQDNIKRYLKLNGIGIVI